MRQIGRKTRAFLFYVLNDCYLLHECGQQSLQKNFELRNFLPDQRGHRLFWGLLNGFRKAIDLKESSESLPGALPLLPSPRGSESLSLCKSHSSHNTC